MKSLRIAASVCLAIAACTVVSTRAHPRAAADGSLGYYRFPALHEDTIVFTAEGDLWRVPITGGVAQRLTTHASEESRPAFSPDGTTLAFSAAYEGPTEVYTVTLDGGIPVRQTFDGASALVVGWTPSGDVLYSTRRYSTLPNTQLARIDPKKGARCDQVPAGGDSEKAGAEADCTQVSRQVVQTARQPAALSPRNASLAVK